MEGVTKQAVRYQIADRLKVSLVIPLRNEEMSLPALISSINQQTVAPDEIILVDGGSTDATVTVAHQLIGSDPRFRILQAIEATPGKGRNMGIAAAQNEWIALTDAGIRLERDWLESLLKVVHCDPAVDVVYGNFEPVTNSFFDRCAALAYVPRKQRWKDHYVRGPFIASSLIRRSVWKTLDGFPDLRAAEDLIFMERIEAGDFNIQRAPAAAVWWSLQPDFRSTFKRFMLYSYWTARAGRQRKWQYGIARQYALGAVFVALALLHSPLWLLLPPLGFAVRVGKSIVQREEGRGVFWAMNPVQFLAVGAILLVIDAATFVGWGKALFRSPPGPLPDPLRPTKLGT